MGDDGRGTEDFAHDAARFFLLSGCSGGGKSTLLAALQEQGHLAFEEPGRQVVKAQMLIDGPGLPWRDQALFAELCVFCAVEQMETAAGSTGPVFFDRGIVDAVAFFDYLGREVPAHLERAAHSLDGAGDRRKVDDHLVGEAFEMRGPSVGVRTEHGYGSAVTPR